MAILIILAAAVVVRGWVVGVEMLWSLTMSFLVFVRGRRGNPSWFLVTRGGGDFGGKWEAAHCVSSGGLVCGPGGFPASMGAGSGRVVA
jgi:hypothetical protein